MPETADRTESLFAAAVALPPDERDAYLERECGGDPACATGYWLCSRPMTVAIADRPARQRRPGPNGGVFPDERTAWHHHRRPLQVARGDWPGGHGDGLGGRADEPRSPQGRSQTPTVRAHLLRPGTESATMIMATLLPRLVRFQ